MCSLPPEGTGYRSSSLYAAKDPVTVGVICGGCSKERNRAPWVCLEQMFPSRDTQFPFLSHFFFFVVVFILLYLFSVMLSGQ